MAPNTPINSEVFVQFENWKPGSDPVQRGAGSVFDNAVEVIVPAQHGGEHRVVPLVDRRRFLQVLVREYGPVPIKTVRTVSVRAIKTLKLVSVRNVKNGKTGFSKKYQ